ncbi:MAG TPA: tetratricopeptide repeat protein, partial [Thermoanaerobaculia bacterium]|nr:tetratricopeptide repeat protein [Thermoanaerobaculia bacterium]
MKNVGVVVLGVLLGYFLGHARSEREHDPPPGDPLGAEASPPSVPGDPENDAVVDALSQGWAADRAGIRPGDVVLSWSRGAERGSVRSPLELAQVEINQAPWGRVTLRGRRNGKPREWVVPPGSWCLWARPSLPAPLLGLYRSGRNRMAAGDFDAGVADWTAAVEAAVRRKDPLRASWLEARLAQELASVGRWTEAEKRLDGAIRRLEKSRPEAAVRILEEWSRRRNSLPASVGGRGEVIIRRAMTLGAPESLAAARYLGALAMIARERGDFTAAQGFYRDSHAILERLAPGSVALLWSLEGLAMSAGRLGDFDRAEEVLHRALAIQERLEPDSLELSTIVVDLGMIAAVKGDLSVAEEHFQRAVRLIQRLSPNGPELAFAQCYFGIVEVKRGNWAIAEDYLHRSLALWEKVNPESFDFAKALNSLGDLAGKRGDFATAEEHYRRGLAISERLAHSSPEASLSTIYYLNNLAAIEKRGGNLAKADETLRHVQAILEGVSRESYDLEGIRYQRALIAFDRGDLTLAEALHEQALAFWKRKAPEGLDVSDNLKALGAIAIERGEPEKARRLLLRALAIREKMAPGSSRLGETLHQLGRADRQQKRLGPAAEHFCRATVVFDQQRKKVGGTTEGKSAFGGTIAEPYRDCVAALVDIGRPQEAFHVLERGRARTFLDLLAQRELSWSADLPPDLDRERKQANAEYDRTQATLEHLTPARDRAEIDRLLLNLRDLRVRQEEVASKIRRSSPRIAALQDPQPLDLAGARAVLDPGTVLLAWSIGKDRSLLFVVQARGSDPGFAVLSIPIGDKDLRKRVEAFRAILLRLGPRERAVFDQARDLYDLLLRPADPWISASSRVLLSPDGPLHTLPFAA